MFTPEFTRTNPDSHVLVANHYVETDEAVNLSTAFIRARIAYGKEHVSDDAAEFVVVYDIRGQSVATTILEKLEDNLAEIATVKVKRA